METKVITGSRFKAGMYLGFFAASAVAFLFTDLADGKIWWGGPFFSLGALVCAWLVIRPSRLVLGAEGFSQGGAMLPRPRKVLWRDVSGFFVVPVRFRTTMIGYNYVPDAAPRGSGVTLATVGAHGFISGVWTCSNAAIVDELNRYHAAACAQATLMNVD